MEKFKNRIRTLGPGIWVVVATIVSAIVSLVLYGVGVSVQGGYQHVGTMVCYIVLICVDIILFFAMKVSFIPACNTILSAFAVGAFVEACYNYVASVATGVDLTTFNPDFIASIVFYVLTFGLSVASIFVPVVRDSADEKQVVENDDDVTPADEAKQN